SCSISLASTPASSRTSRIAAASAVSSPSGWPFGRPRTRLPCASRLTGTITTTSRSRTTTPPAENSALPAGLIDVPLQCLGVMHDELAPALGDDAGTLEHGQEPTR